MSTCRVVWPIAASILLLMAGCAKDEGPVVLPRTAVPGTVDTAYFNTEVVPIFTQHCLNCHPTNGGLDLGAAAAYTDLVNVVSMGYAPDVRIVPGDPDASVLWHKVSGSPSFGLTMPPSGATLNAAELQTIRDWIEQGALNN